MNCGYVINFMIKYCIRIPKALDISELLDKYNLKKYIFGILKPHGYKFDIVIFEIFDDYEKKM